MGIIDEVKGERNVKVEQKGSQKNGMNVAETGNKVKIYAKKLKKVEKVLIARSEAKNGKKWKSRIERLVKKCNNIAEAGKQ